MGSFRSGFEKKIRAKLDEAGIAYGYESSKLDYIIPESKHKYTPDFNIRISEDKEVLIEAKGYFDPPSRNKLLLVRSNNPTIDLRILFQNAGKPIRKGSGTTYGDWATKNGFIWAESKDGSIPAEWLVGATTK